MSGDAWTGPPGRSRSRASGWRRPSPSSGASGQRPGSRASRRPWAPEIHSPRFAKRPAYASTRERQSQPQPAKGSWQTLVGLGGSMTDDRFYFARMNDSSRERLRSVLGRIGADDLDRLTDNGWTVKVHLAHLAYTD